MIQETIKGEGVHPQLIVGLKSHLLNLTKENVKRYIVVPLNDKKKKKKKKKQILGIKQN